MATPSSEPTSRDAAIQRTIERLERARVRAETLGRLFEGQVTPSRVDRFELRRKLGQGAMGVVYAAFDPRLSREVALKLLFHGPRGPGESFLREARALAEIAHPNVLTVYDAGLHDGVPFLVSELVSGGTLRTWLGAHGSARAFGETVTMLTGIAQGIAAAHAAGLVHRDIKPENVLVGGGLDERPRLADFSLAKGREIPLLSIVGGSPAAASGPVVGTLRYMSPEQLRGDPADDRSDQWSFCALAFEAFYGAMPFGDRQGDDLLAAIARGQTAPVPAHHRAAGLLPLLQRGLRDQPAARHASMNDLLRAWERELVRGTRVRIGVAATVLTVLVSTVVAATVARAVAPTPATARPASAAVPASGSNAANGPPANAAVFANAEEADLFYRAAALTQGQKFDECASLLRGQPGRHVARLQVECAERSLRAEVLASACRDAQVANPAAVPPSCLHGGVEAKAFAEQKRYLACIETLERAPAYPFVTVQMSTCVNAWGDPEGFYRLCQHLRKEAVARAPAEPHPPCVKQQAKR